VLLYGYRDITALVQLVMSPGFDLILSVRTILGHTPVIFRCVCKTGEKRLLASSLSVCLSVCLSVRPHGTPRLLLDGVS
jgi:hypothetical protein